MKIGHIMSMSKIITDLSPIRQSITIESIFANIVYNVLEVKKVWRNIKKLV